MTGKEAFVADPNYWQEQKLPGHFCFGFVNGHLLIGNKHHQQIMAKLINAGWTWDQLMNAPQAWGWGHYMTTGQETGYIWTTFTSDAGLQNDKEIKGANAAIAQLYRLPVRDSGEREQIDEGEEYGSGLEGKNFVDNYGEGGQLQSLLDKVQGPVPPPPIKTAVAVDPEYWINTSLPPSFCFGYVAGHLFLGTKHHQQIIARLLEQGWTWEDLMNAEQAWGWGGIHHNAVVVSFTSDAGFQNNKAMDRAKGAISQMYHLPVDGASVGYGVKTEDQYGSGIHGKDVIDSYLSEGTDANKRLKQVQAPVPFPAPPGKEQPESDYWTCPKCNSTNVYPLGVGPHDRASIGPLYCPNCGWRSDKSSKLAMPMNPPEGMWINVCSEYAGAGETHIIFEAVLNGSVIGELTIATRMSHEYYDDEYYIGGIEVDPDYRRRGIATLLLQDAEKKLGPIEHDWNAMTPEGNEWAEAVTSSIKEAVEYDPKYWRKANLQSNGCFGWINGHLLLGEQHHQQIMAKLIASGWTWEDLMNAQQAWGWFEVGKAWTDHPRIEIRFTSDAGYQNEKAMVLARGAFAQMYHMPVENDYAGGYVKEVNDPGQYGSGLSGKENVDYHLRDIDSLNAEVKGEVPEAPPTQPAPEIGPGSSYVNVPGGGSSPPKKTPQALDDIPPKGTVFTITTLTKPLEIKSIDPYEKLISIGFKDEPDTIWVADPGIWKKEWLPLAKFSAKSSSIQKKSAWTDLMDKATRLRQSGGVQLIRNDPDHVVAQVKSGIDDEEKDPDKPDYYTTEIWRDDPQSNAITMWNCDCQWSDYSWGRTRQWKKYEGRPCAHTLATFWEGQVKQPGDTSAPPAAPPTPLPGGAMLQNQGLITPVLPSQPGQQSPVPGMPPPPEQAPPEPQPQPAAPAPPAQSTLHTPNDAAQGTLNFPGAFSSVWKESDAGFSLKMTQPEQYKYGYNPTTGLQVWKTHPVTGDPHHFEVLGEGHEKYPSGRIYYYGPNDIFHMVWANRGLFSAKQKAQKEVENWVRQNLNGNVTYTGEENDEALKSSSWKEAQGVDGEASTGADGIPSATPSTTTQEPLYESSYHALRYMPHHRLWHLVSMSYPWLHEKTMRGHAARRVHKEWHRRNRTSAGLPGETPLFGNGDLVRARTPLVGVEPQSGQEMNVPQNSAGEVLDADDDEAWVIFPLSSGPLGPHLVKVRCHPEEIYLDPKAQPFIWKKHHGANLWLENYKPNTLDPRWLHDADTGEVYLGEPGQEHHDDIIKKLNLYGHDLSAGVINPRIPKVFATYYSPKANPREVQEAIYNELASRGIIDPLKAPRQKVITVATQ